MSETGLRDTLEFASFSSQTRGSPKGSIWHHSFDPKSWDIADSI